MHFLEMERFYSAIANSWIFYSLLHFSISYTINDDVEFTGMVRGESCTDSTPLYQFHTSIQCGNLCSRQHCAGYSLIEGDNDVTCALTADRTLLPVDDWETFVVVKETYSDFSDLVSPCELFFPV